MSQSRTLFIGIDVHQDAMAVADVAHGHGAEVTDLGTIGPRQGDLDQLIRKRPSQANQLIVVYEAGPCGSWLSRDLTNKGDDGWGVAPSLIPKQPGDRLNTARRDAVPLARLARSGDRTAVDVPTGRATWGPAHLRWLADVVCPTPTPHLVLHDDVRAVHAPTARLQRLEPELHDQVTSWRVPPVVDALQARRGVPCTVAVTLGAERGELTRFDTPRALMTCLGLIPSA